jgi:hypothetical protein
VLCGFSRWTPTQLVFGAFAGPQASRWRKDEDAPLLRWQVGLHRRSG